MKKRAEGVPPGQKVDPPHRVRLPKFIGDEEIGLGEVIKRTTSYLGIPTCRVCGRRADALSRWLVFTNR